MTAILRIPGALNDAFGGRPGKPAHDQGVVSDLVERHLTGESTTIKRCRVLGSFSQGALRGIFRREVVRYELVLARPGKLRERCWVTGVVYPEKGSARRWSRYWPPWVADELWYRRASRRSERGARAQPPALPGRALPPRFSAPELGMSARVFPSDRRLPGAAALSAGGCAELERLLRERFADTGWDLERYSVEPIRYWPEQRATFRVTATIRHCVTDQVDARHFYAKVHRHGHSARRAYTLMRDLAERDGARLDEFAIGAPVGLIEALDTVVQEAVMGTPLSSVLRGQEDPTDAMRRAARALARLQVSGVTSASWRRPEKLATEAQRWSDRIGRAYPAIAGLAQQAARDATGAFQAVGTVPSHGDLALEHVLDGERPALVDFDTFALADPLLDPARLLAELAVLPLLSDVDAERAHSAADAFVGAYFDRVPEAWRGAFPSRYAVALLRRAGKHPDRPRGRGREDVAALVHLAVASLDRGARPSARQECARAGVSLDRRAQRR